MFYIKIINCMDCYPLISIALCTYNGSRFLVKQLDSIINQTYPNLEIIVVDDCSTDNTIDILLEYQSKSKYKNITVVKNDLNRGINYSFGRAIELCSGDYIAISDQDDIWMLNKLENYYNQFKDKSIVLLYSNSLLIDENDSSLNKRMFGSSGFYTGGDPRTLSLVNSIAGHTMLFRSSIKANIIPIPKNCNYDWRIAFVAINQGEIVCLADYYVQHRLHSNNASNICTQVHQNHLILFQEWSKTMLSVRNLKHKSFFEELDSIASENNLFFVKKMRLLFFQIKNSRFIYPNKSFLSRINRARKLNLPVIPE